MKKKILAIVSFTIIGTSCSKQEEIITPISKQNAAKKNRMGCVYADRKLKTFTVTDSETGKTETVYDCSESGSTCDVGNPTPPGGSSGLIVNTNTINDERLNILNSIAEHNDISLKNLFTTNDYSNIFQALYSSNIYSKIIDNSFELSFQNNYLVINEGNIPVFVYNMNQTFTNSFCSMMEEEDLRVAKYNTETGKMECIDCGKNCNVKSTGTPKIDASQLIQLSEYAFQNSNLKNLILSKQYNLVSNGDFFEYIPVNSSNPIFYLKK